MQRVRFISLLVSAVLLQAGELAAEPVTVRHAEGTSRGFLVLRTIEDKTIAAGDLIQVLRGNRLVAQLIFHFKDGSVDDETTGERPHRTLVGRPPDDLALSRC